jgi:hypothetical protein
VDVSERCHCDSPCNPAQRCPPNGTGG